MNTVYFVAKPSITPNDGFISEPFRWGDPPRHRAQIRAELDAYYARLYGLARDELRYTPFGIDPEETHGEDSPGETFRVLKEKEVKQFGDAPQSDEKVSIRILGQVGRMNIMD